ncbi:mitochondrial tRNA-specific 2-thiouridylase 1 [Euwallacea fornicatus]|uniref:mitochondrial tRNA-specific 2-thiouridylase 1 n=1 Tax=Euwallacea fornicatus TaxID=995702 RepID=UPI00338F243B
MIKRVALGISGGVDSAVAALLLKTRGYDVQGVFMRNWDIADEKGNCRADEDLKDASYICDKLNIPLHQVNFVKEYWNEVFSHLLKDYESGDTPNPDILCNKNVKFKHFFEYAQCCLKADAIATGHYARTSFGSYLENYKPNTNVRLLRAQDIRKDQTFFLCQLQQQVLRRTMFPLGDLTKWEVKHIAVEHGLERIALKPESMGICFIGSRNFQDFIKEYIEDKPGKFIDIDTGQVVGEHQGIHQWTLGQRSRVHGIPEPYFICQKNVKENIIYVVQGTNHPALYSSLFFTCPPHWISLEPPELKKDSILHCYFKFQHTNDVVSSEVCQSNMGLIVKLKLPKRALTPGQYAVFYRGNECLGSAKIIHAGASEFSLNYLKKRTRDFCDENNESDASSDISFNKGS